MIAAECTDYDTNGFADLDEAIALAKAQGVIVAKQALHKDVIWNYYGLGTMLGLGKVEEVPGINGGSELLGVSVRQVDASQTPVALTHLLQSVEESLVLAAGEALPDWHPTSSPNGVRMVTMHDGAVFMPHSDDYEGLVAAIQLALDGKKTLHARINGENEYHDVLQGDVILFGCDSFSESPRVLHGFEFVGVFAVSFTLGQDPFYTISGRRPLLEDNPEYLLELAVRLEQSTREGDN